MSVRKQIVIIRLVVEACEGQTNDVDIGGTNDAKFKFLDPVTSNSL